MSYEARFIKKSDRKEEVAYFRCSASDYSVAYSLLDVINAPQEWYQHSSFPLVTKEMNKDSLEKALSFAKKSGPDYYIGDKPYYVVRDVLQTACDSLSYEDKVIVELY